MSNISISGKIGWAIFAIGVVFMCGLGWLYSWRMVPAANQYGSEAYSSFLGFVWALSVPLGAFVVAIGAALVARVERRLYGLLILLVVLLAALTLAGCYPELRVGELQTETQSVEMGDAETVHTKIDFGAGNLKVTGGAEKLLEADFTYNVARLKPEVKFTDGRLDIREPGKEGRTDWLGIRDFRNEWSLHFNDEVPMDLSLEMGAGFGKLQLTDISLTGLDITLGAGEFTIDLNGDWKRDLDVAIDSGAAEITILLPQDLGVRVEVESGPTLVNAPGLIKDGRVYTNDAYGRSDFTLQIKIQPGIGLITLEEGQTQGESPTSTVME